jgi:hypothetical protein
VYEPAAQSYERAADNFAKEFRRKVRIVNRAWRALWRLPGLLNPLRHGFFAIELLSHKLLRWLMPVILLALLVVNALLLNEGPLYQAAMLAQLSFYLLALVGRGLRNRRKIPALFSVPYYFCLINLASAFGIIDAFRGKTYTTWSTARATGA